MYEITKISPTQIEDTPVITDSQIYAKRVDFINDNLLYKGEAIVSTAPSASSWRIKQISIGNDGDIVELWADGNTNFDNIWNDRLTLGYS
jgi:hypothetical protein